MFGLACIFRARCLTDLAHTVTSIRPDDPLPMAIWNALIAADEAEAKADAAGTGDDVVWAAALTAVLELRRLKNQAVGREDDRDSLFDDDDNTSLFDSDDAVPPSSSPAPSSPTTAVARRWVERREDLDEELENGRYGKRVRRE